MKLVISISSDFTPSATKKSFGFFKKSQTDFDLVIGALKNGETKKNKIGEGPSQNERGVKMRLWVQLQYQTFFFRFLVFFWIFFLLN